MFTEILWNILKYPEIHLHTIKIYKMISEIYTHSIKMHRIILVSFVYHYNTLKYIEIHCYSIKKTIEIYCNTIDIHWWFLCVDNYRFKLPVLSNFKGCFEVEAKNKPTSHTPSRQCPGRLECDSRHENPEPKHVSSSTPCHAMFFFPCLGREASS